MSTYRTKQPYLLTTCLDAFAHFRKLKLIRREVLKDLREWLHSGERKPLILRGARQVGKTWAVRTFFEQAALSLVEINLERNPAYGELFREKSPEKMLVALEKVMGKVY